MLKSKFVQMSLLAILGLGAAGCKDLPGTNDNKGRSLAEPAGLPRAR